MVRTAEVMILYSQLCFIWNFLAEGELIVNLDTFSREKFPVAAGDFIEVSVPDAEEKIASKLVQPLMRLREREFMLFCLLGCP